MQAPENDIPQTAPMQVFGSFSPILIGASTRSAAQSASQAGLNPISIDQFADQDTRHCCQHWHHLDPKTPHAAKQLNDLLKKYSGSPVIQVGGWGGLLRNLPTQLPTRQAAQLTQSEQFLKEVNQRFGFATNQTASSSDRLLIKNRETTGGMGVRWRCDHSPLTDKQYLQAWRPGRAYGACFVTNELQTQWIGTSRSLHRRIGDRPFVYCGSMGPLAMKGKMHLASSEKLQRAAEWIAKKCKLTGVFNIDFLSQRDGSIELLEINPRWSASCEILERAWQKSSRRFCDEAKSLFGLGYCLAMEQKMPSWIELEREQVFSQNQNRWYKRIVFASSSYSFCQNELSTVLSGQCEIADVPREGEWINPSEPVCTLIVDRRRTAEAEIRNLIRQIRR